MGPHAIEAVDAFDLPEWLGVEPVTWRATSSLDAGHHVTGELVAEDGTHPCDLLACDLAYPGPVLEEKWRAAAHQSWFLDEVLLVAYDDRLTLVMPGTAITPEPTLEAVRRLAKAVGAPADRFTVSLRL